jgi:Recombinase
LPDSSPVKRTPEGKRSAKAVTDFIERLTIPSGTSQGKPFKLEPFQKNFIRDIYEPYLGVRRAVRRAILSMARDHHFAGVWQSNHCPPTLKKMIFRTAIEEIIVRTDQDKKTIELVIHWKGGAHTQLAVERPRSVTETATPMEALEIIRRMAVRYGDDQIASVLNRRGYSTGKGKRWNQTRVATARRNHSIAGQKRASARSGESQFERSCANMRRQSPHHPKAG